MRQIRYSPHFPLLDRCYLALERKHEGYDIIMHNYKDELERQLNELDNLILQSDRNLRRLKNAPDRGIAVSRSNGCDQYFWVDRESKSRVYAKACELDMIRKIAQRDYESAVNAKLKTLRKRLDAFLKKYDVSEVDKVYSNMSEARQKLVSPVIDTDETFLNKWRSVSYDGLKFTDNCEFYTNNGIRVRSKSELIIANALEESGVPYRYECPLFLKGLGNIHPDFTCLNVKDRKEIIWEHFGMMDNIAYANKNTLKIQAYNQNGYLPGKNLIMTFETSQHPISSGIIKNIIEEILVPRKHANDRQADQHL